MSNKHSFSLTPTQLNIIGLSLCLAATAAVYWFGVNPMIQKHNSVKAQATALKQAQDQESKASTQLAKMVQLKSDLIKHIKTSSLQLKPRSYLNQHVSEVSRLAQDAKLKVISLQPGKSKSNDRYLVIPIQVTGSGTYPQIVAFLNQLHSVYPDTLVFSFRVSTQPEQSKVTPTFNILLHWHASPSTTTPPVVVDALPKP